MQPLTAEFQHNAVFKCWASCMQGQHNNALAALETVITSHVSQCAAAADAQQQQRQHLQQQVQECQQTHDARLVAVESAAKDQATAVSELASIVAGLPSKEGIKEAVIAGTRATAEGMLQEHKQEEEQRWEVRPAANLCRNSPVSLHQLYAADCTGAARRAVVGLGLGHLPQEVVSVFSVLGPVTHSRCVSCCGWPGLPM